MIWRLSLSYLLNPGSVPVPNIGIVYPKLQQVVPLYQSSFAQRSRIYWECVHSIEGEWILNMWEGKMGMNLKYWKQSRRQKAQFDKFLESGI